jgi:hypothetical protein
MKDFKAYQVNVSMSIVQRSDGKPPSSELICKEVRHAIEREFRDEFLLVRTTVHVLGEK